MIRRTGFRDLMSPPADVALPERKDRGLRTVYWMDSSGRTESLEIEAGVYQFPRISPDAAN